MMPLDRDRWQAISPYLDHAIALTEHELAAWLGALRSTDPGLATDLESWCAEHRVLVRHNFLEGGPPLARPLAGHEGERFGSYTIESLIGQGGMGTVWRARRSDGRFEATAAVKVLNAEFVGRGGEERFSREGNFLARLTHPHIARLLDAGVTAFGQPYLVLEHIEGRPIDRYVREQHLGTEDRLRLFLDVLAAVAHAHANLIVHRDIKPSNVLVSTDGMVKLLDFGIATLLDSESEPRDATLLTRDGGWALTPEYAAPEQVTGGRVTTATDVYALGVLLYVLVGGRHPAGNVRSVAELMRTIVEVEPPRPSELLGTGKSDLDVIVAKALKKDARERYSSVTSFADDLRRYVHHEPIGARPDTLAYRAAKFVRRHRASVAFAAVAVAAMGGGLVGTVTQARRAGEQRDFALRQLSRAEAINDLNQFVLADFAPSGKPVTVDQLLAHAERIVAHQPEDADEDRVEMLIAIGRQYQLREDDATARRVLTSAYASASRLSDGPTRAKAACALAGALARAEEGERAETLIREAEAALPAAPHVALHRIYCLMRGSEVARDRNDLPLAIERIERAKQLAAASAIPSALMQLRLALSLAETYHVAGRARQAIAAFRDASARLTALGRGETEMAGTLSHAWAMTYLEQGQPLEAERLLRHAIAISTANQAEAGVSPVLLANLGRALGETGRLREAVDCAERADAGARAAGDEVGVMQSMFLRAALYRQTGELARSAGVLAELQPRVARLLPAGHPRFASLASEQSMFARAEGRLDHALVLANRALDIAQASSQGAVNVPRLLTRRSELLLELQQPATAAEDAARAIAMQKETSEPDVWSRDIGLTWMALGRAHHAQGRSTEARTAFASALEHLRASLGDEHPATRAATRLMHEVPPK